MFLSNLDCVIFMQRRPKRGEPKFVYPAHLPSALSSLRQSPQGSSSNISTIPFDPSILDDIERDSQRIAADLNKQIEGLGSYLQQVCS